MPLTVDEIVEQTRTWPAEELGRLVDRLTLAMHGAPTAETEAAWKIELRRRVTELESGQVEAIPGEEVSARVRRIVGG